jgi:iron complex transport system ATP-binding protein
MVNLLEYQGDCLLHGEKLKEVSARKLARKVSYIPQRSGIQMSMSVLDVVLMGFNPVLKLLERPNKKQRERK